MKLSKNLSLAEVTKSNTAKRLGIDNTPDDWATENLRKIAEHVFQPLRDAFKCPIYVSSGYRSPELNAAIGGSVEFDQMVWEFGTDDNPNWVHVSFVYDGINRKRCLRARRDDKGEVYYEVMFGKSL
jgi:hypothetical protein